MAATINLAGCMCRKLGIGHRAPEPDFDLASSPGAVALGVASDELDALTQEFKTVYEENRGLFMS